MAELSILGLYSWDNSIFDNMCYPGEFTVQQKQNVVDNILMECAELEVLYPDPVFMKKAIAAWSFKELPTWTRIYKAALAEYNPIENYRRHEEESSDSEHSEQHSGNDKTVSSGQDTSSGTNTVNRSETTSAENTNSVTGYDSNAFVNRNKDAASGTATGTDSELTSGQIAYGKTDTLTHGEQIDHTEENSRTLLAYGNIGVTTSQEMLKQELEIAGLMNITNIMVESFKNRFCILVY